MGRDRLFEVIGPLAADAVTIGAGEVVLRRSPLARQRLARSDRQRRHICRDRLFEVIGPLAADAVTIGKSEVVLSRRPLARQRRAGKDGQRRLKGRDQPFQVVGPVALTPLVVGLADAKPKLSLDALAWCRNLPSGDRWLERKRLLAKPNLLLRVLRLLPALIEPGKFGSFRLLCPAGGLRHHR